MGWSEVKPEVGAGGGGPKVRLSKRGLVVTFGAADAARLGWRDGQALSLLVGDGEEHGRIALRPADKGPLKAAATKFPRGTSHGLRVTVGRFPQLLETAAAADGTQDAAAEHRPQGMVILVLPDGWLAPPASVPPTASSGARPVSRPPGLR